MSNWKGPHPTATSHKSLVGTADNPMLVDENGRVVQSLEPRARHPRCASPSGDNTPSPPINKSPRSLDPPQPLVHPAHQPLAHLVHPVQPLAHHVPLAARWYLLNMSLRSIFAIGLLSLQWPDGDSPGRRN
ncbi:hypothetical protein C8R44DRAFT_867166 [Mycena epipterygia]|nr:hypothetical protein C8R44DRAFT_867166 [Mycena epipterygia]